MDYKKFNAQFDIEGLKKDMADLSNGNDVPKKEVPAGDYEVSIEKLTLTESKAGNPMVSCWMKVLVGDYADSLVFYNQVVNNAYGIYNAKEFLKSLASTKEVEFHDFEQFGNLIDDIYKDVITSHEYLVEITQNEKNGNTYRNIKIKKVYDIEMPF